VSIQLCLFLRIDIFNIEEEQSRK